eukprot:4916142-Heterocapsa_arctica.AAC.1
MLITPRRQRSTRDLAPSSAITWAVTRPRAPTPPLSTQLPSSTRPMRDFCVRTTLPISCALWK